MTIKMKRDNDVLGGRGQEEEDEFSRDEKSYPVAAEMTELTEVTDQHPWRSSYSVSGTAPGENDFP
jgi:hypothetical protein